MCKIERYRIAFGRTWGLQTRGPTTVRRFLCFWTFKGVRLQDIDKKPQFPLGTELKFEGKKFYYYKAGKDIVVRDASVREKV